MNRGCEGQSNIIKGYVLIGHSLMEEGNYQKYSDSYSQFSEFFNPLALRMAKTLWSFGRSECNRVKVNSYTLRGSNSAISVFCSRDLGGTGFRLFKEHAPNSPYPCLLHASAVA